MSSPFHDRMGKELSWIEALNKILFRVQSYWLELVTGFLLCLNIFSLIFFPERFFLRGFSFGKKKLNYTSP